jgi:hypothetical protein
VENFAEQREQLTQSIERCQKEVNVAMHELTDAAGSKLDVSTHIKQFPLTWVIGAFLVGIWLGSHGTRVDGAGQGRS